jgi:hypothetical protein
VRPNYALQRTVDAPSRGALRRGRYIAPGRTVLAERATLNAAVRLLERCTN